MFALKLAVAAAIVALSNAAPASIKHVLHEKRQTPSSDWVKAARIESTAILPMRIGLTQNNLEKGHDFLMEVSHPDSLKYGQYWTQEEIHDMFAPSEESVQAVREWLTMFGIHESRVVQSDNKGWIAFDATVEEAEELLLTEYYEHEHNYSPNVRVGCDEYHIPEHLKSHIDYITPGVKLTPVVKRNVQVERRNPPRGKKSAHRLPPPENWGHMPHGVGNLPEDVQGCGVNITPPCWKALYQLPEVSPPVTSENSFGLFEQGDYFAISDLQSYLKLFAPQIPIDHLPIPALIDGAAFSEPASNTVLVGGEADIDVEIATSLIFPQTITLYQTDDQIFGPKEVALVNTFNTFLDALDGSYCTSTAFGETGNDPAIDPVYPDPAPGGFKGQLMCGVFKPTHVISASYGEAEADLPFDYTHRQCNEFLKLGLQGVSILFASGDFGVASAPGDGDANGCLGPDGAIFNPQYPSNCPYVTSVGGTMLYADQTVRDRESVMQVNLGGADANFSSSGGFSNFFSQPDYQKDAVADYFARHNPPYPHYSEFQVDVNTTKGLYNRIGRAYPDVASNGAFMNAIVNGNLEQFFGTSLAAPTFGSILTLINEERTARGKGPVGFVNPVLYANPGVLNDIVNGTSLGCDSNGFQAVPGWDPVTGLGTANYPKMLDLFLSLP